MGDAALRGTNTTQDVRFKNKEKMAMKATKFPKEFTEKVDIRKVNLAIMRPWVTTTVTELAGIEDDIVIEFVMQLLESKEDPALDPRKMQIQLGGFLTPENAAEFMLRLWKLLLSAQASHGGIPAEFVEAKKQELMKRQEEEAKMQQKMMEAGGRRDQGRPPSRFDRDNRDRQPVPRDRDGRAFPQDRDYGQQRGYQGGGAGGDRGAMRDTYIPSDMRRNDGRGGGGRGRDGGYQSRPRDGGYPDRRDRDQGRPRSPDPYQGNSYRDIDRKPDFNPRRGRYFEGNDRSPANARGRSASRSRSRSRSPTPPRRRRRSDASATPSARRTRDRDNSATPPASGRKSARRRERSRSRSPSRSATPPRSRRDASRERRRSPDGRKKRKTEDDRKARRESATPPRRSAREYTPTPSPSRRSPSRTPPRRKRSADSSAPSEDGDPFNKERL